MDSIRRHANFGEGFSLFASGAPEHAPFPADALPASPNVVDAHTAFIPPPLSPVPPQFRLDDTHAFYAHAPPSGSGMTFDPSETLKVEKLP